MKTIGTIVAAALLSACAPKHEMLPLNDTEQYSGIVKTVSKGAHNDVNNLVLQGDSTIMRLSTGTWASDAYYGDMVDEGDSITVLLHYNSKTHDYGALESEDLLYVNGRKVK